MAKATNKSIRQALKIDDNQRIAQYLYNLFREYEKSLGAGHRGLDIFHLSDEVFIDKINDRL